MAHSPVTLTNLGNGKAVKKFEYELQKALDNCMDPNTDTKVGRKVTLTVTLTPDASRQKCGVVFKAESRLAADSAGEDHLILTRDKTKAGRVIGNVDNAEQLLIDDYQEDVSPISKDGTDEQG